MQQNELKSKPILRKLNFRGMNQEKFEEIKLDVFEKEPNTKGKMKLNSTTSKYTLLK